MSALNYRLSLPSAWSPDRTLVVAVVDIDFAADADNIAAAVAAESAKAEVIGATHAAHKPR